MKLLFVGTGAADYPAALHCPCANCSAIRRRGGRNLRHYASLLVNGALLVDCGPTVPWRLAELGTAPEAIAAVAVTHSHSDHLDLDALFALQCARTPARGPLPLAANERVMQRVHEAGRSRSPHTAKGCEFAMQVISPGETFTLGGLTVTALAANHILARETALNYLIDDGDRRILYASDTAWPLEETWQALSGAALDAVICEATFGPFAPEECHPDCLEEHLNWPEFLRLHGAMCAGGIIKPDAPFIATHLSLHWVPLHEEFCASAVPPVMVAWDGLTLEL